MSLPQVALALACVLSISIGQVVFKLVGTSINATGTVLAVRPLILAAVACAIYGLATVGWINLLRSVTLVRAYPYMALSFCLVPMLGALVLDEKLSPSYPIGVVLIVSGVLLIGRPG